MSERFLARIRANLLLFCLAVSVGMLPGFVIGDLLSIGHANNNHVLVRVATIVIACLSFQFVKRLANAAYVQACNARQVIKRAGPTLSVADPCRRAWLVQLHIDLHRHQISAQLP